MLSLIVALSCPAPVAGDLRFALSRDAATGPAGLQSGHEAHVADHGSAPLALLPRSDELVVVVPAQQLSWHRVVLPKIAPARLRSALDGMLEERLLDEPQLLHFALAPGAQPGAPVWLAACDKAWLQSALQAFEAAGRRVARVVPEYSPLPDDAAPRLHAVGSQGSARLVRCASDGVQSLPLDSSSCAALGLGNHGASTSASASASGADATDPLADAEPAVAALAEQLLGAKVPVRHSAQGLVAAARSGWDLAQFDLASSGSTRALRRAALAWAQWAGSPAWRPARWGLTALLLVNLAGLNLWAWHERQGLQAQRDEMRSLLLQSFPRIPVVVDAPLQMQREVAALRQASGTLGPGDFEPLLAAVAQNAGATAPPAGIDYSANDLTLKGFTPAPVDADTLRSALHAAGYRVREEPGTWRVQGDGPARDGAAP